MLFHSDRDKYVFEQICGGKISHENHMKFPHKSCKHVKKGKESITINNIFTMLCSVRGERETQECERRLHFE